MSNLQEAYSVSDRDYTYKKRQDRRLRLRLLYKRSSRVELSFNVSVYKENKFGRVKLFNIKSNKARMNLIFVIVLLTLIGSSLSFPFGKEGEIDVATVGQYNKAEFMIVVNNC